jgi:NitT/TauT family transport system permease protein
MPRPRGSRPTWSALAPAVAGLVALLVHLLLPNRQLVPLSWMDKLPAWRLPYPLILESLIALSLVASVLQLAWRPLRGWARHYGPLLAGAALVLCSCDLITLKMAWMPQPYFPGPNQVFGALIEDRAMLANSAWHSLQLLLAGYAGGVTAGIATGILIGWFKRVRYWGMPVLKLVGPIPATALVALVMMLSNNAFICAAALIAFAVWFPVTMLTYSGIANVRPAYLDVARTLGAGRLYLIFRVAFPAALPTIFIGLFMGLTVSFLTLIVAENVGVPAGLGWYVKWQQSYADYAKVYAALVIMSVFFSTLMTLLFRVRDWMLKWQEGVIKW